MLHVLCYMNQVDFSLKISNYISIMAGTVKIIWNDKFVYAIGLFTADGCLSSDHRHLEFNSKDKEQVLNFVKCLNLSQKISRKTREREGIKEYYRIQFSDVKFYKFLNAIGLYSRKSKTIKKVEIPKRFLPGFPRGLFDGDGCIRTFMHPESKNIQLRICFSSASLEFLKWLREKINNELHTKGFIQKATRAYQLNYAIYDSVRLLNYMYYSPSVICLSRKYYKVKPFINLTT